GIVVIKWNDSVVKEFSQILFLIQTISNRFAGL
ncbi:hypothetical protein UYO_2681, partial [Lachnospiraceae bacterium JC7]